MEYGLQMYSVRDDARADLEGTLKKVKEMGYDGFGYDCLFYSLDLNKSFGEATAEEKNGVSHRKRAIEELLKKI